MADERDENVSPDEEPLEEGALELEDDEAGEDESADEEDGAEEPEPASSTELVKYDPLQRYLAEIRKLPSPQPRGGAPFGRRVQGAR